MTGSMTEATISELTTSEVTTSEATAEATTSEATRAATSEATIETAASDIATEANLSTSQSAINNNHSATIFTLSSSGVDSSRSVTSAEYGAYTTTSHETGSIALDPEDGSLTTSVTDPITPSNYAYTTKSSENGSIPLAVVIPITTCLVLLITLVLVCLYFRRRWRHQKAKDRQRNSNLSETGFTSLMRRDSLMFSTETKPDRDRSMFTSGPQRIPDEILLIPMKEAASPILNETPPSSNKVPPILDVAPQIPADARPILDKTPPTPAKAPPIPAKAQPILAEALLIPDETSSILDDDILEYVQRHEEDLALYEYEFMNLPTNIAKNCNEARTQENASKNRYANVVPFDENRVILCKQNKNNSDYINASFIDGTKKKAVYIVSQGPLTATLPAFWSMIWEQKCNRIVMLTNLEESIPGLGTVKASKCAQYWPPSVDEKRDYGNISVLMTKEITEENGDWTIRIFTVQKKNVVDPRTILQYHYTAWPDQDVPDTCTSLLKFHRISFASTPAQNQSGPIMTHCSAGVGRTGTLIAIDILLNKMKENKSDVDVFRCVMKLRQQRMSMVQSLTQYVFIHHCLLQAVKLGDRVEIDLRHDKLCSDVVDYELIQQQYTILEVTKPSLVPQSYSNSAAKSDKNRSLSILPANSFVQLLSAVEEDHNIYINAVSVYGFSRPNRFIVTQMPLANTINDFWRLVKDKSCSTIVMLNDDKNVNLDERYFPTDGHDNIKTKSFYVSKYGESFVSDGIRKTDIGITFIGKRLKKSRSGSSSEDDDDEDDSEVRNESSCPEITISRPTHENLKSIVETDGVEATTMRLQHFSLIDLESVKETRLKNGLTSTLLSLYHLITKRREMLPNQPVLIHCLDGVDRSGLFCSLVNVLDRINQENVVGIFDAVKLVRRIRPQFITSIDQYKLLHLLVDMYLKNESQSH